MMNTNKKAPKLRFKGFTDDWEQRKLGNLATVEMNKRIFKEQTTTKGDIPFYKIGTFGSDADSFISRELFEEYKNKYPYPNIGDILISASGSIGRTVVYNGEDAYYQDSNIVWLNHNGLIDNSFLLQFYNQVKWAGLEGSTIKRLYNKNILETNIALPKIEEQRLIGKFFKLVDSSITLYQRKLDKMKLNKRVLLQKLFPQNGCTIPEVRFKGFTDAWEQRKLNDFVTIRRGLTYKPSDIAANGVRVLRSSNIDEDQFIKSNDDVFVNIDAVNIPFAKNGDILITSANGSNRLVGKHTIINDIAENSAVHGGFMLLAESNNPLFTDALLSSNWYKRFINTYVAGGNGAIGNLSKSDLESQSVMVPSEYEQTKIGQWYDNINQLITLHQCKLDRLISIKKALLQQLFV